MKIDLIQQLKDMTTKNDAKCDGLIFRGMVNDYISNDGDIIFKSGLRFLKSKSCKGCSKCEWMWDEMRESNLENVTIPGPGIDHRKLYTLKYVPTGRDWETGTVDDYELEVIEVKE